MTNDEPDDAQRGRRRRRGGSPPRGRSGGGPGASATIGWRPGAEDHRDEHQDEHGSGGPGEREDADDERDADRERCARARSRRRGRSRSGLAGWPGAGLRPAARLRAASPWVASPSRLRLRLRLGARPDERAAPRPLAPEVGRPRVVPAPDADAAPRPVQPVGDVGVPRRRPQLRLQRVDPPAAAGPASRGARRDRSRGGAPGWVPSMKHSLIVSRVQRARSAARPAVDRRADDAVGSREVGDRRARGDVADERPPERRGGRQRGRGLARVRVSSGRCCPSRCRRRGRRRRVRRRREVAVRREVAGVVRRAGLDRGRAVLAVRAVANLEGGRPDRVLLRIRVAGEDVRHEVRGLRR